MLRCCGSAGRYWRRRGGGRRWCSPSWSCRVVTLLVELLHKPVDLPIAHHLVLSSRTATRCAVQAAFSLACLPYEAWFSAGAILRTQWRIRISHRRLLEWMPSTEVERRDRSSLPATLRAMWIAPVVAAGTASYLLSTNPAALPVAFPILLLWLSSPVFAWWISRPLAPRAAKLTHAQTLFLRKLARRTWAYFEAFVGPTIIAAPDNFQEVPPAPSRIARRRPTSASRFSPTSAPATSVICPWAG